MISPVQARTRDSARNSVVLPAPLLPTSATSFTFDPTRLSVPADASLVAAYVYWSGSLRPGDGTDPLATVWFPDGTTQPVTASGCQLLDQSAGSISRAYYCAADVSTPLKNHLALNPDGSRTLYVLENGRPHAVNVKIGSTDGELTEITSGLEEGAQVITASQQRS